MGGIRTVGSSPCSWTTPRLRQHYRHCHHIRPSRTATNTRSNISKIHAHESFFPDERMQQPHGDLSRSSPGGPDPDPLQVPERNGTSWVSAETPPRGIKEASPPLTQLYYCQPRLLSQSPSRPCSSIKNNYATPGALPCTAPV